ncbi:MAG TPA: methylamine utilization protein [Steroidobacteraceae bacterium]|nr:methylamine utilization protein [Steroidobacteraceae bacterium]
MNDRPTMLWPAVALVCLPGWALAADLSVRVQSAAGIPLEDAIVYAVPNVPARAAQGAKYVIDQINRTFVPRVNVVQSGTAVSFPNSDNIRHSVYSFSPAKKFALKLYAGRLTDPVLFDRSGLVVLGCNIHDVMVAWLMVVDTPYFAHSDRVGIALLARLPSGDYTLHTWHAPMTEDQERSEPLHVDAGAAGVTHTVHIDVPVDPTPVSVPPP